MRRLYDAIEFSTELDLLNIRLETLDSVVDNFIISESIKSHTGSPKPLHYLENRERFRKFWPKIIHQVIEDTPDEYITLSPDSVKNPLHKIAIQKVMRDQFWPHDHLPYSRDAFEKESLIRAMERCYPEDIVMFSDADELPRPEIVFQIKEQFDPEQIYNLEQNHYWFYLNCLRSDKWIGNTLLTFEKFKTLSVCELRKYRRGLTVKNSGWHFSFMGGGDKVRQKIESYGEQSINRPDITDNTQAFIDKCIKENHDFYYNPCNFTIVDIDETFPEYIQNNKEKLKDFIK